MISTFGVSCLFQDFQLPQLWRNLRNLEDAFKKEDAYTSLGFVSEIKYLVVSLYIKIPDMNANWKNEGIFSRFWRGYMEKEASKLAETRN